MATQVPHGPSSGKQPQWGPLPSAGQQPPSDAPEKWDVPQWALGGKEPAPKVQRSGFPRWRIFTWVILAYNLIMLIWAIAGGATAQNCNGLTGDALTNCQAHNVGTGIGVGLIILLWALGDIILGVIWLITRPHKRYCPACGNSVRKGLTRCGSCGFDFNQAFRSPPPGAQPPPSLPTP